MALSASSDPVAAQTQPAVSLSLVAPSDKAVVTAWGRRVPLDLGLYVAASGGNLELRVTRPAYDGPIVVTQVDPGTGATRPFPPGSTNAWRGLKAFFDVTVRSAAGRLVHARRYVFCPNSEGRQRINDEGAPVSGYPGGCGSSFPFLRGMIWGIDRGWAVGVFNSDEMSEAGVPSVALRPGRYTATVRITSPYAELFAVPADRAEATVSLTVRSPRRRPTPVPDAMPRHSAARANADAVPTVTDPDPATLPDLAALPAWNIRLDRRRDREFLTFAASPWNAGPGPMIVEGFRRPGDDVMDAFQYFYDAAGNAVGRAPAGEMAYDPRRGHHHWHFLQFARYALVDAAQEQVVVSRKQAYCLAPTDPVDLTLPGTSWRQAGPELWTRCGSARSLWVRETLFAGWADTYYQEAAGQALEVTRVPNGRYDVVVTVNPLGALLETTTENNVAARRVTLSGRPGNRRVTVAPWNGITQ